MRFYEYRLSPVIYGKNKPDLCYSRANNQNILYDDSEHPRIEIARVFFGDKGWTFSGKIQPRYGENFANAEQARFAAFSQYSQQKTQKK